MGWLISIFFIINYFVGRDPSSIVAAGLFAIAGSIELFRLDVQKLITFTDDEERQ